MRVWWYRWKAQFSWGWLGLLFVLLFLWFLLFQGAFRTKEAPRSASDLAFLLEVALPLGLAVMLAGAPSLDRDAGTAEIHLTTRLPALCQLLSFLPIPVLLWAAAAGATAGATHIFYAPVALRDVAEIAVYPALALGGAALCGSALARHQVGGILMAVLWWGIDLTVPGQLNRLCYLFNRYQPLPDIDPEAMRLRMLLFAAVGMALALVLAGRRERWIARS